MSDYEEFWNNREKFEEQEVESETVRISRPDININESYEINGESVHVHINSENAVFSYVNRTSKTVPLEHLRFCPECVREKKYPFTEIEKECPDHKIPMLPFDVEHYEKFKLISKMEGGRYI